MSGKEASEIVNSVVVQVSKVVSEMAGIQLGAKGPRKNKITRAGLNESLTHGLCSSLIQVVISIT